jgi:phage-related protein
MIVESLKILLEAEDKTSDTFKKAASSLNQVGEKLERVASAATMASAAISAAAAVAVNEASKYDRRVKTAVDQLKGAYSALSVQIGQALIPTLRALAGTVSTIVRWFQSLSPGVKEAAAGFAMFAASALAVLGTGANIGSIFAKLAPTILPILPALAAVAAALVAIIVVVGLVQEAWDANFGGIQDITKDVVEYVAGAWKSFTEWFKGNGSQIGEAFTKVGDVILTALVYPLEYLTESWSKALRFLGADTLADGLGAISGTLKEIREGGVKQLANDLGSAGETLGLKIAAGAKRGFKTVKDLASKLTGANGALVGAGDTIDKRDAGLKGLVGKDLNMPGFEAFKLASDEAEIFAQELAKLGDITKMSVETLSEKLGVDRQLAEQAKAQAEKAKRAAASANATQNAGVAQDMIKQNLGGVTDIMNAGMAGGPAGVFAAIAMKAESFQDLVGELNGLVSIVADFLNPMIDALRPFINVIGNVLNVLAPVFSLLTKLTPIFMILTVALPIFFEAVRYLGVAILYAAEAVSFVWNGIVDAATWLVRAIGDMLSFIPGVEEALDGFADSIAKLRDNTDYAAERTKLMEMSLGDATASIKKERKERDKLNESILNSPSGYRVNGRRFGASDAGSDDQFLANRGTTPVNVTLAIDGKKLTSILTEIRATDSAAQSGSRFPPEIN